MSACEAIGLIGRLLLSIGFGWAVGMVLGWIVYGAVLFITALWRSLK